VDCILPEQAVDSVFPDPVAANQDQGPLVFLMHPVFDCFKSPQHKQSQCGRQDAKPNLPTVKAKPD
jgi:hypothetical protein